MEKGASISACGKYRYLLWRRWGDRGSILWIMLNPSTADSEEDDATIRRCMGFTKALGCEGFTVLNLFALRATNPKELKDAVDPIGPLNNITLSTYAGVKFSYKIAAWGVNGNMKGRDLAVAKMFAEGGLSCLAVSHAGYPKHPLYLPKTLKPFHWRPRS